MIFSENRYTLFRIMLLGAESTWSLQALRVCRGVGG